MFSVKNSRVAKALLASMLIVLSSCTLKLANSPANNNQVGGSGGSSSVPAPIVSPTSFNSTDNDYLAVSLYLDPASPSGTKIYYTTDGSDPTTSVTALEYILPIALTYAQGFVTLRAVSQNGTTFSAEAIGSYWFGDWEYAGDTYLVGAAGGFPATIFVDNNIPYVVHKDPTPGTFKVEKLVAGSWSALPLITGCYSFAGGNLNSNLFVEAGIPYVTCHSAGIIPGVYTRKYVSGSWQDIGASPIPFDAVDAALFVENGTPYVALINTAGYFVQVYYYDGAAWTQLGANLGKATKVFLRVKNGVPYVGFHNSITGSLEYKKFDGSSWNNIGTIGAAAFPGYDFDFAVYDDGSTDGKIYVIYNSTDTHMKVYDGSSWTSLPGISGEILHSPTLNVYDDIPYLTYNTISDQTLTKRFYAGTWSNVGTISYHGNVVFAPDAAIAEDGTVYTYYSTADPYFPDVVALVESFGPGGSGVLAHVEDPLMLYIP